MELQIIFYQISNYLLMKELKEWHLPLPLFLPLLAQRGSR